MDRHLIEEKLESLRHCLRRVEEKCPVSAKTLISDWDLQDILSLNLTRAIQLCVDIAAHIIAETEAKTPETLAAAFDTLHALGILGACRT